MAGFVMGYLLELAWRARPRLVTAREVELSAALEAADIRCDRLQVALDGALLTLRGREVSRG